MIRFTAQHARLLHLYLWRARWWIVGIVAALAVRGIVVALISALGPGSSAVVFSSSLESGHVIAPSDLEVRQLRGGRYLSPEKSKELIGKVLGTAVPEGLPAAPELLERRVAVPTGKVSAPVRLVDPSAASNLEPGDLIVVLAPGPVNADGGVTPAQRLADEAEILEIRAPDSPESSGKQEVTLFCAVTPKEAEMIASASAWQGLSFMKTG